MDSINHLQPICKVVLALLLCHSCYVEEPSLCSVTSATRVAYLPEEDTLTIHKG